MPLNGHVELESGRGVTRRLSAHNAVIAIDVPMIEGDEIQFVVRIPERVTGTAPLLCDGTVSSARALGEKWDVVVEFEAIRFGVGGECR